MAAGTALMTVFRAIPARRRALHQLFAAVAVAVWLTGIGAVWWAGVRYESAPGSNGIARDWPAGAALQPAPAGVTLLFFAHPQCPCTRASLAELERIVASAPPARLFVLLADVPEGDWRGSNFRAAAGRIPNCTVISDPGGELAAAFGAEASGHAALYNAGGRLLYWGGVTSARGVRGENAYAQMLTSAIHTATEVGLGPVFGCPLQDEGCD